MPQTQLIRQQALAEAKRELSAFVTQQAELAAQTLGFGWVAVPDAPSVYEHLRTAYAHSRRTGTPMPVSSLYCDPVIYDRPATNHAVRFWHDTLHVRTGLTFNLDDELELGLHHLRIAETNGITKHGLAWQILRIDMLGQNYLMGIAGRFPLDQATFVEDCLSYGFDDGVLREARRTT